MLFLFGLPTDFLFGSYGIGLIVTLFFIVFYSIATAHSAGPGYGLDIVSDIL